MRVANALVPMGEYEKENAFGPLMALDGIGDVVRTRVHPLTLLSPDSTL